MTDTAQTLSVRPVEAGDKDAWEALWAGYVAFYEADVPAHVTAATWARLMDAESGVFGLVAVAEGAVVGIVNCVLHANTWMTAPVCYLEDLFVAPDARGKGAGRALIEAVAARAREQGWGRVYWMTKASNADARALYDRLAPVTDWVRYDYPL